METRPKEVTGKGRRLIISDAMTDSGPVREALWMFNASVNSKHQHPALRATPGVLHSTAAPGPGFTLDDFPRGPGFCISIKLRLVQ